MTSRTVFAAIAAMVCICGNGRDMPIQNGRLVNALNANQNMITNLPPEFWEGHEGGGITAKQAGAIATNTVDAKVAPWAMKGQPQPGGGGADTNAVNDLIREYDTTNLTARINYRTTTNDVNAIIASSNLCTVAAAEAMTNGFIKAYGFDYGYNVPKVHSLMLDGVYVQEFGDIWSARGGSLDMALNNKASKATTLDGYGITDAYTKTQVDAATNALYATTERKFIVGEGLSMTNRTVYKWSRNNPDFTMYTATVPKYDGHYESVLGYLDSDLTVEAYIESQGGTMRAGVYAIYHDSYMWNNDASTAYYSTTTGDMKVLNAIPAIEAAMNMTNGVRTYADATFAPKLTGKTYDFANGVNFTKNLYTALTNVIQTLGGTVTNPPNFD